MDRPALSLCLLLLSACAPLPAPHVPAAKATPPAAAVAPPPVVQEPVAEAEVEVEPELPPLPPAAPGVTRCGKHAVCVPPVADPLEACRAALTLLQLEGRAYRDTTCQEQPVTTVATAKRGALRGAALVDLNIPDTENQQLVVFASAQGYDRVVDFFSVGFDSVNGPPSYALTKFAFDDVVQGGELELHMEANYSYSWGYCASTGGGESVGREFAFCGLNAASEPYCVGFVPRERTSWSYEYSYETDKRTDSPRNRFALDVRVQGKSLVVKQKTRYLPEEYKAMLGKYTLEAASDRSFGGPF